MSSLVLSRSDSDSETGDTAAVGDAAHQVGQSTAFSLDSGSRKVDDDEDDINNGRT